MKNIMAKRKTIYSDANFDQKGWTTRELYSQLIWWHYLLQQVYIVHSFSFYLRKVSITFSSNFWPSISIFNTLSQECIPRLSNAVKEAVIKYVKMLWGIARSVQMWCYPAASTIVRRLTWSRFTLYFDHYCTGSSPLCVLCSWDPKSYSDNFL